MTFEYNFGIVWKFLTTTGVFHFVQILYRDC